MSDYNYVDHEKIRLSREGIWLSDGEPITHSGTCRAFSRHIGRDESGYFVRIGNDFKRIEVEDTPFFIRAIGYAGDELLRVHLNDESEELLDPGTLRYSEGRLSCEVKRSTGGGPYEARFLSAPYHELLSQRLAQDESGFFLRLGNRSIRLSG